MPEVEVRLRAVVGHKHLPVLNGIHRARVNVQIRVQLHNGDLQTAVNQKPAEGSRRNALAEAGHHAAGNEDVFSRHKQNSFGNKLLHYL